MYRTLAAVLLLAGCAAKPAPAPVTVCPVAPVYSKAFEQAAGQQLAALPPDSPLVKFAEDYITVRAELKECR